MSYIDFASNVDYLEYKLLQIDLSDKDDAWRIEMQGQFNGLIYRDSSSYVASDTPYTFSLCWIAKPTSTCEGMECTGLVHIDVDENHDPVTSFELVLHPYTLTTAAECGTLDYKFTSSLTPKDPASSIDGSTYNLFEPGG